MCILEVVPNFAVITFPSTGPPCELLPFTDKQPALAFLLVCRDILLWQLVPKKSPTCSCGNSYTMNLDRPQTHLHPLCALQQDTFACSLSNSVSCSSCTTLLTVAMGARQCGQRCRLRSSMQEAQHPWPSTQRRIGERGSSRQMAHSRIFSWWRCIFNPER